MSIDERLDRLTERHEALAQTVELIAAEIRDINGVIAATAAENKKRDERMAVENRKRDVRMGQLMEGIGKLLRVAEIHEHRLTDLEGGPQ